MARMWRENDGMSSDVFTIYIEVVGHRISKGRVRARQIPPNVVSYNFHTQIWRERGEKKRRGSTPLLKEIPPFKAILVRLGDTGRHTIF